MSAVFLDPEFTYAAKDISREAMEKAVEQAAQKAVENVVKETAEKTVEKAAEKAAEKTIEKVAEKAVAEATEKAAASAAAASELLAQRPDAWWRPTKVYFLVFVVDIDNIDDANQNFTANVYLRMRWKDERLANPDGATRQISLEEVWNPRILLANRQGLVSKSLPDVVQVSPDGMVIYHQRYTGLLSQPLDLSEFPLDRHTFNIHFVAAGYSADELEFIPDTLRGNNILGGSMAEKLSLPDWKILRHEALPLPYRPINQINTAGFAFRFVAERYFSYYVWQIVFPLGVVVLMSCSSFWFERTEIGIRITIGTSSVLTIMAYRFVLASLIPRLPYMTRMDFFTVGCTLLVFLVLVTVVLIEFLTGRKQEAAAQRIDTAARIFFPASFIVFLALFLAG
ncbi:MAG: hypothetical protein ACU833_00155 [Gammaproteobacteria bacterium]